MPTLDIEHSHVPLRGDTRAGSTAGSPSAWERARFDGHDERLCVTVTTPESKVLGSGGGWLAQPNLDAIRTRIDAQCSGQATRSKHKPLSELLPPIAPHAFEMSFARALQAR